MHSFTRRPIRHTRVLLITVLGMVALTLGGLGACTAKTKHCSTVLACSTAGSRKFGAPILTPRGATFVQGMFKNGALVVDFRDSVDGASYREFVGRPKSTKPCVTTIVDQPPVRPFCYGPTTTALQAQFTAGTLVYVLLFTAPPQAAATEQPVVARIVSSLS